MSRPVIVLVVLLVALAALHWPDIRSIWRRSPDFEVNCTCGNPNCHQNLHLRKGYVHDATPGAVRVHWDELYICTYGLSSDDHYGEVMLERKHALRLAWWLMRNFWRP